MNDRYSQPSDLGLGIDVGGSTIKGGVVDLRSGKLIGPRRTVATPKPATTGAIAGVIAAIASGFAWHGPVGVASRLSSRRVSPGRRRISTTRGSTPISEACANTVCASAESW